MGANQSKSQGRISSTSRNTGTVNVSDDRINHHHHHHRYVVPSRQEVESMQTAEELYFEIARHSPYQQYQIRRLHATYKQLLSASSSSSSPSSSSTTASTPGLSLPPSGITKDVFLHHFFNDVDYQYEHRYLDHVFRLCDIDHDGFISFSDLIETLITVHTGTREEKLRFLFSCYDRPNKGYLNDKDIHLLILTSFTYINTINQQQAQQLLSLKESVQDKAFDWYQQQYQQIVKSMTTGGTATNNDVVISPKSSVRSSISKAFRFIRTPGNRLSFGESSSCTPTAVHIPVRIDFISFSNWCLKFYRYRSFFRRFNLLPTSDEERITVKRLMRNHSVQQQLVCGDEWYLLSMNWWKVWCRYCAYEEHTMETSDIVEEEDEDMMEEEEDEDDNDGEKDDGRDGVGSKHVTAAGPAIHDLPRLSSINTPRTKQPMLIRTASPSTHPIIQQSHATPAAPPLLHTTSHTRSHTQTQNHHHQQQQQHTPDTPTSILTKSAMQHDEDINININMQQTGMTALTAQLSRHGSSEDAASRAPAVMGAATVSASASVSAFPSHPPPLLRRFSSMSASNRSLLNPPPRSVRHSSFIPEEETGELSLILRPMSIDNTDIQSPSLPLEVLHDAQEGRDYIVLPAAAWNYLLSLYGGGPSFGRKVVSVNGSLRIEIYPFFLTVVRCDNSGRLTGIPEPIMLSCQTTIPEVYNNIRSQFNINTEEEFRVWFRASRGWTIIHNNTTTADIIATATAAAAGSTITSKTIEDLKWGTGDELMLEIKQRGVPWLLAELPSDHDWFDIRVGDIVDAKDRQGNWYKSDVIDIDQQGKLALIHFHGWSAKWREEIPLISLCYCKSKCHCGQRLALPGRQSRFTPKKTLNTTINVLSPRAANAAINVNGDPNNTVGISQYPGMTGLSNLGNTCFISSVIECLSNTPIFASYFISNRYEQDLNKDNPLGNHGILAIEFAHLLQELWNGQFTVVTPRRFKAAIAEFAPQFSGYQQQDAHELLAYLLDGLHEDLNRIKQLVTTAAVEEKGRPDAIVAKESWDRYQQRNQSIIVDLFCGLLKSTLQCPSCQTISRTFDCYRYLTVPIPYPIHRRIHLTLVTNDQQPCSLYTVMLPEEATILQLKQVRI